MIFCVYSEYTHKKPKELTMSKHNFYRIIQNVTGLVVEGSNVVATTPMGIGALRHIHRYLGKSFEPSSQGAAKCVYFHLANILDVTPDCFALFSDGGLVVWYDEAADDDPADIPFDLDDDGQCGVDVPRKLTGDLDIDYPDYDQSRF